MDERLDDIEDRLDHLADEISELWKALSQGGEPRGPKEAVTSVVALVAALGVLFGPTIAVLAGKFP